MKRNMYISLEIPLFPFYADFLFTELNIFPFLISRYSYKA